jgi:excisionase family DNA binding protein
MDKLLLRPMEVAELLGLSRSRVYELIASRELPTVRIGVSRRVPIKELNAWIARRIERKPSTGRGSRGGHPDA